MTTHPIPRPRTSPEAGLEGYSPAELASIWQQLDASQREFITLYYRRARDLHKKATDAWNKRGNRLQYLLDYCKANKYNDFQTRQKIINDWVFCDANDDWLRFGREIRRCEVAIDMELKMSMLIPAEVKNAL